MFFLGSFSFSHFLVFLHPQISFFNFSNNLSIECPKILFSSVAQKVASKRQKEKRKIGNFFFYINKEKYEEKTLRRISVKSKNYTDEGSFFPSPSYPFCSKQHNKYEGCFLVEEGHKEGGFDGS